MPLQDRRAVYPYPPRLQGIARRLTTCWNPTKRTSMRDSQSREKTDQS